MNEGLNERVRWYVSVRVMIILFVAVINLYQFTGRRKVIQSRGVADQNGDV